MSRTFVPQPSDIKQYARFRDLRNQLNKQIQQSIPREATLEVADSLGLLQNDTLVIDNPETMAPLFDSCFHDWIGSDGKNLVQRYVEEYPAKVGSELHLLQQAYVNATYQIVQVTDVLRNAGVYCIDTMTKEEFFLMDISMSLSAVEGLVLLSRIVTPETYSFTTGAALPLGVFKDHTKLATVLKDIEQFSPKTTPPHIRRLSLTRLFLGIGATDRVRYEEDPNPSRRPRTFEPRQPSDPPLIITPTSSISQHRPRPGGAPSRNGPCPCGSGQKYKKCCEGKE